MNLFNPLLIRTQSRAFLSRSLTKSKASGETVSFSCSLLSTGRNVRTHDVRLQILTLVSNMIFLIQSFQREGVFVFVLKLVLHC